MAIPLPNPNIDDFNTSDVKTWSSNKINSAISSSSGLPDVTPSDEGKTLMVNSSGEWDVENVPKELPNINPTLDPGKLLGIDPNTGKLVWMSFGELIQNYLQGYPYIDEFDPIASDGYSIARSTLNDILKYEFDNASTGDVLYYDGSDWVVGNP